MGYRLPDMSPTAPQTAAAPLGTARAVVSESAFGRLLREWRSRRRVSQLDLAVEAGVSSRHVSFIETGRAQPSREMVLMLARVLDVPLRDRNDLLTAAGYAAMYRATDLDARRNRSRTNLANTAATKLRTPGPKIH